MKDNFTKTVDAAEAFERFNYEPESNLPTNDELKREAEAENEDFEFCGCSDPGCPCERTKERKYLIKC